MYISSKLFENFYNLSYENIWNFKGQAVMKVFSKIKDDPAFKTDPR